MLKELLEKLNKVAAEMRKLFDLAEKEDRGFTPEEQEKWDAMLTEHDELESRVAAAKKVADLDEIGDADARRNLPGFDGAGNERDDDDEASTFESRSLYEGREPRTAREGRSTEAYDEAYNVFLRHGANQLTPEQRAILQRYPADMGERFAQVESRAQATTPGSAGGFTIPEGFAGYVTERLVDFSGFREAATPEGSRGPTLLRTGSGNNIPFPTNDDTGNAGTILAENAQVPEQDTVFGQRTLGANMYTSRLIRVSLQLLQDEEVNLVAYLANILGKRIGRALSPHFAVGTGSAQPTGIATAATDSGVNISTAAGITYVNLLDIEHALDPAYRRRGARWGFNDTVLRGFKGLLDTTNRPLWLPALTGSLGQSPMAATLMGYPYIVDQGMPNVGVGTRPIVFGDMSEFIIREVLGLVLFRFNERYMDFLQIGWMGYGRWDSNLIDVNAVVTDIAVA